MLELLTDWLPLLLAVALRYGRHAVGIELNPEYVKFAARRLAEARRAHGIPLFDRPQRTP